MKAAPSVVSPLQPNDSGSQISKSIDLPPVARGLKLLSRVGLRFAQNALKTDHGFATLFYLLEFAFDNTIRIWVQFVNFETSKILNKIRILDTRIYKIEVARIIIEDMR